MDKYIRFRIHDIEMVQGASFRFKPAIINADGTKLKMIDHDRIIVIANKTDLLPAAQLKTFERHGVDLNTISIDKESFRGYCRAHAGLDIVSLHQLLTSPAGVRISENYENPILRSYQRIKQTFNNPKDPEQSFRIDQETEELTATVAEIFNMCDELNRHLYDRQQALRYIEFGHEEMNF